MNKNNNVNRRLTGRELKTAVACRAESRNAGAGWTVADDETKERKSIWLT